MGYYQVSLDEESAWLCTIILPWGKYQYLHLPMGNKTSPDFFQVIILNCWVIHMYADYILITTNSTFQHHLQVLESVLSHLQAIGFHVD